MNSVEEAFKILETKILESLLSEEKDSKKISSYRERINKISLLLNKKSIKEVDNEFLANNEDNIIVGDFQSHRYSKSDIIDFYDSIMSSISNNSQRLPLPTILGVFKIIEFSMIMNTMNLDEEESE
jgi:hypothetical protein